MGKLSPGHGSILLQIHSSDQQMLLSPQIQTAILRTLGIKIQPGLQATVLLVHQI